MQCSRYLCLRRSKRLRQETAEKNVAWRAAPRHGAGNLYFNFLVIMSIDAPLFPLSVLLDGGIDRFLRRLRFSRPEVVGILIEIVGKLLSERDFMLNHPRNVITGSSVSEKNDRNAISLCRVIDKRNCCLPRMLPGNVIFSSLDLLAALRCGSSDWSELRAT